MFSSIIDNDLRIHEHCPLETGTVLGPRVVVCDGAILFGVRVRSDMIIQRGAHVWSDMRAQ